MNAFEISVFIVGILSSVLVLVSYLFTNQKVLRIINLVGSIVFVIYGLGMLCGGDFSWTSYTALPIVILNSLCAGIHIYHLFFKKKDPKPTVIIEDITDTEDSVNPDVLKELSDDAKQSQPDKEEQSSTSSEKDASNSQASEN